MGNTAGECVAVLVITHVDDDICVTHSGNSSTDKIL